MNSYKSGENFIDHIYQELINTEEVKKAIQRRSINPKNREEAVRFYMERMQHAHNTQRKIDILKRFYYKKYVIDHLPESYIERQWRIAREQGHGNIRITDEIKRKMLEDIQSEQRKSIDRWLDYLNSADAMYPMWFKYYAFQGMIKLGKFNKEKKKFGKRTKDTTNPFIEVNPEILGQMYTILSKIIEKQELTEEETKTLEKGESFQKLYTSLLIQMEENRIANGTGKEGIWIKYEQGDNYQELWKSLQGKNTGWCTAGEETCKIQVAGGDFYVYYTYDKEGKPTQPRIAIRMDEDYEIAEIRGIGKEQNIEPEMIKIVEAKLKEFPYNEGERYQKKVHDMSLLTEIERKTNNNEELTKKEIIFLYEIEFKIEGFGWMEDPRIKEIINKRKTKKDIKKLDIKTIIKGIHNNSKLIEHVPIDTPNYEQIAMEAVKQDGTALKKIPTVLSNYEQIAMEAVKNTIYAFKYVPSILSNYEQIAMIAVKQFCFDAALKYIPKNKITLEIATESVKVDWRTLRYVPKRIISEEMAKTAVEQNGKALKYVPTTLPNYKQIALEALKKSGYALENLPTDFPYYEQIALTAVKDEPRALKYVPTDMPNYEQIAMEAVKHYGLVLEYVPINTTNYEEIAMEAVKNIGFALKFVPTTLSNYEQIVLEALKDGRALKYVPTDMPNYEQIAMEAVKYCGFALKFVPTTLSNYEQIALEAVKRDWGALKYVPKGIITEEMALEAIKQNYNALKSIPKDKITKEISKEALKQLEIELQYKGHAKR